MADRMLVVDNGGVAGVLRDVVDRARTMRALVQWGLSRSSVVAERDQGVLLTPRLPIKQFSNTCLNITMKRVSA